MTLVNDIRQYEPVTDDDLSSFQGRANDASNQLGSARHKQERLRPWCQVRCRRQENLPQLIAERSPAWVSTTDRSDASGIQPVDKHPALGRLARAVDAVELKEWCVVHVEPGTISSAW